MVIPCLYLFRFSSCHNKKSPDQMVWGFGGALSTVLEPLCRHLVAAFRALQAKKRRNISAFQPLLMSLFELILMQGNCFHKELIFFRSVWIVHMETLTNNVKMVEKLNGIG